MQWFDHVEAAESFLVVLTEVCFLSAESGGKFCELSKNWCPTGTESHLFLPRRAETVPQEVRQHRNTFIELKLLLYTNN